MSGHFNPSPSAGPVPQPQPQPSDAAQAWAVVERSTDPAVLEAFIKHYGDTFYGTLARSRLAELKRQQVAMIAARSPVVDELLKRNFFNGEPFIATTPANVRYKMVFTLDGKMSREPLSQGGTGNDGTWRFSPDGICTTWPGSKENCFKIVASGKNRWAIMVDTQAVLYWSK